LSCHVFIPLLFVKYPPKSSKTKKSSNYRPDKIKVFNYVFIAALTREMFVGHKTGKSLETRMLMNSTEEMIKKPSTF